jgi:hydroxymethylbilane synthase
MSSGPIYIATRGSALALAQANMIMAQCRSAAPDLNFELKIIKTTGDKLQTASMAQEGHALPKGLFTKELEVALLNREASLAVHSLKDLPTELPDGLILGAVTRRADVRDVLIYRDRSAPSARGFGPGMKIRDFPAATSIATSSTRRKAQLKTQNPGLLTPDIRGNVATRMRKLLGKDAPDATVLALAGMNRLNYRISAEGKIEGTDVPDGLLASVLDIEDMLPCVGQAAIGIEIRKDDEQIRDLCAKLTDYHTAQCVTAERAFLAEMGGGCQSPVAALAQVDGEDLVIRALSFAAGPVRSTVQRGKLTAPEELGRKTASELKGK